VLVVRHAVLRYCSTLPRNLQLYVAREYCLVIFFLCLQPFICRETNRKRTYFNCCIYTV